jgi:hypothetical protein
MATGAEQEQIIRGGRDISLHISDALHVTRKVLGNVEKHFLVGAGAGALPAPPPPSLHGKARDMIIDHFFFKHGLKIMLFLFF